MWLHTTKNSEARKHLRRELGPSPDELMISPVEAVSPVLSVSFISSASAASSVKTQAKARLNEDIQPIQLVRATSEDVEINKVVRPQMDTEGTSNFPIVLNDDSEEDIDMEDKGEADEPIPNTDHPQEDGTSNKLVIPGANDMVPVLLEIVGRVIG
jgi:hypothetical protein